MASPRWPRPVLAAAAALAAALTVGGCVAMPSAGPVQAYPVTQGPSAQAQPYVQIVAGPPRPGWNPKEIVEGFLTASANFGDNQQVARQYLTQQASKAWNPGWSAIVYKNGPDVRSPVYSSAPAPKPTAKPTAKSAGAAKGKAAAPPRTATVTITGAIQATLSTHGSYAVASTSGEPTYVPSFELVKVPGGQWRISQAPQQLLLTADSFANDYQVRNLYFFDPLTRYLVPDPVYVPLQTTPAHLMDGLVNYLINQPHDWLAGDATRTAFPTGTKLIGDVTLDGPTAIVNLGGAAATALSPVMEQVSAQLLQTMIGVGQGGQAVKSIEVQQNGKPWSPPHSQENPVQSKSMYNPASGVTDSGTFYYLGSGGAVISQAGIQSKPVEVEKIGTQFRQIAVSPDGKYLAAVNADGDLYTGPLRGALVKRGGTGYTSVSWDPNDDLWATENAQVVVLLQDDRLVPVNGVDGVTALQVSPDGVRVAMIIGGELLDFGAISWQQGPREGQLTARIVLSPFSVQILYSFQGVTWYGPDNVITLASNPGSAPSVTEYPVDGGNSTAIPPEPGMESISTSPGYALVAGRSGGQIVADVSLTGTWQTVGPGTSPVYPG
jgi:hypothetical protein